MVTLQKNGLTEFRFYRPDAEAVFLAGDFNNWRTDQLDMVRQDDGCWTLNLSLPAGDYRFRYVADGQWYTDFAAFGVESGRFGLNSVLHIPQPMQPVLTFPSEAPAAAAA